jgi:hypothetical protein
VDYSSHTATNDIHIGGDSHEPMGDNHLECTRNDASTSTIALYDDANNNNLIYIENNPEAIKAFVVNYIDSLEEKEEHWIATKSSDVHLPYRMCPSIERSSMCVDTIFILVPAPSF